MTLLIACGFSAAAQHVPGVRWMQREGERFILIYPESLSSQAGKLAGTLDRMLALPAESLPPPRKAGKWPIILSNQGVDANGLVQLAPRRSVWYAAPGEDFTAVSNWWRLLALHEGRHMAQYDAANQGLTRVLRILFGELGWGIGLAMAAPRWVFEGDAVDAETRLSPEGRGRDPLFTGPIEAWVADHPEASYDQAANRSLAESSPGPYQLGYMMMSWIRSRYGEDAPAAVFASASRLPLPVLGLNRGVKDATGRTVSEIYDEMAADILARLERTRDEGTPVDVLTLPARHGFSAYDVLLELPGEELLVRRERPDEAPALIRLSLDSGPDPSAPEERELLRLPAEGRVTASLLPEGGFRVAWNTIRRHPVVVGVSSSDVFYYDFDQFDRVRRRGRTAIGSRYMYPALSPAGERMIAAELLMDGRGTLTVLNTETGAVLSSLELDEGTASNPSWSPGGRDVVFVQRTDRGRRLCLWDSVSLRLTPLTEFSYETVKTPVFTRDGLGILYSSNADGGESVYLLVPDTEGVSGTEGNTIYEMASRPFGIYAPQPAAREGLFWAVEYASADEGERIVSVSLERDVPESAGEDAGGDAQNGGNGLLSLPEEAPVMTDGIHTERAYPESPYNPFMGQLRVHSWAPSFSWYRIQLGIEATDVLGRITASSGISYMTQEKAPGAYAALRFSGWQPVLGLSTRYSYRNPLTSPVHQVDADLTATLPLRLATSGSWMSDLTLVAAVGGQWQAPPENALEGRVIPVLTYQVRWDAGRLKPLKSIHPDLGGFLKLGYAHIPMRDNYGDSAAASAKLYLPGLLRGASFGFGGGIERRTADFSAQVVAPARGYGFQTPPPLALVARLDYEFPLFYPDWAMGPLLFIQRFRLGVFSDFGFTGNLNAFETGAFTRQWSTGATLTMDFSAFNSYDSLSVGLRFSWLWKDMKPSFQLMIMDVPFF